jgi:hypothetical protein
MEYKEPPIGFDFVRSSFIDRLSTAIDAAFKRKSRNATQNPLSSGLDL